MSVSSYKQKVGKYLVFDIKFPFKKQIMSIGSKGILYIIIEAQTYRSKI